MKLKITLSIALITFFTAGYAQTADEVVNKYLEATGGVEKWKSVKSMKMEGKVPTPNGEFPLIILLKGPNKSKVVVNVQGKELVQAAYDGETGWSLNPFAGGTDAVKLDEEQTKELKDQELEDALIDYKKKGHAITLEGKEEIDGVQCYKIKLEKNKNNDKDDVTEIRYFDAENAVLIMSKSYLRSGPGKGTEIQNFVSDYQEVNGLMVPFSMDQRVNGNSVSKITFTKILMNENLDDSVFAFPKK